MNFIDRYMKNPQILNFMKIRPVGAELFHADRRTGMAKLTLASRYFANSPKKCLLAYVDFRNGRIYLYETC